MSSPPPIPSILPKISMPPFSRIPFVALYNYPIGSGSTILPYWISVPGSGKIKIYVAVSEPGYLAVVFESDTYQPMYLNNGNTLNANTFYEFELPIIGLNAINFIWYTSSSVTSATIYMWVYFEPDVG